MMVFKEKSSRIAVGVSILAHILLLLLFAIFKMNIQFDIPEFTEISFARGSNNAAATPRTNIPAQPPAPAKTEPEEKSELVKLPLRKMLDQEEPQLKTVDQQKQLPVEDKLAVPPVNKAEEREIYDSSVLSDATMGDKEVASPLESISPEQKLIPSATEFSNVAGQAPYEIEGEVARRSVTSKVIPEYPENLQKQAIIKIRFTVLPNGQVGEMLPLIKSDAQLEKVTLDALRQWRFNSLPSTEPQQIETGVITFRYLLK